MYKRQEAPKDQRIYYFNTKELTGNKYGTPSPVPFRVVDQRAGIDIDIAIRCFGEYSIRLKNPMLFYTCRLYTSPDTLYLQEHYETDGAPAVRTAVYQRVDAFLPETLQTALYEEPSDCQMCIRDRRYGRR